MAFDGITVAALVWELKNTILDGRISKIAQPEPDELLIHIKTPSGLRRLYISASASLPLMYLTDENKTSPMVAPGFCMLLRKYIGNGRIIGIDQPSLERVIRFSIQHLDELGDVREKQLYVEIMGKHSNIIFCDDSDKILDSIKHVSANVSSVREVFPGRTYFIVDNMEKKNPLETTPDDFSETLKSSARPLSKAVYTSYTGISPVAAHDMVYRAGLDPDIPASELPANDLRHLFEIFSSDMEAIRHGQYAPHIYRDAKGPVEFSVLPLASFQNETASGYASVSSMLYDYYAEKNQVTRIRQKSADLRHIVQTALERNYKKFDLQSRQLKDTESRDKYREYGELIQAYGYQLPENAKQLECENFYTNKPVTIPLDPQLTPQENATRYFNRYNKQKRTFEALSVLLKETGDEIHYLESIATSLELSMTPEDLSEIKEELMESGYIRRRGKNKKTGKINNKPLHYVSSDGFDMYVGKNNLQNDYLTFTLANGGDWWFHAKGAPGSHVIVKSGGEELPDQTFEEAGRLAAHYSKNRDSQKVEIDYIQRKHVKKPNGAKPGFVVYYTNYSLVIDPDISGIKEVREI